MDSRNAPSAQGAPMAGSHTSTWAKVRAMEVKMRMEVSCAFMVALGFGDGECERECLGGAVGVVGARDWSVVVGFVRSRKPTL